MSKKLSKNQIINLRVTMEQKDKIKRNAEALGMTVSNYLLSSTENQSINVIDGGKELAREVYCLNKKLEHFLKYPFVPVQELRDTISQGIEKMAMSQQTVDK